MDDTLKKLRDADSDAQWIAIDPPMRNIIYDVHRWQRVTDAQAAALVASRDVVRCTGNCVAHCKSVGPVLDGDVVYHVMNGWRDIEARLKE